jgi:Holliday junction resolvase
MKACHISHLDELHTSVLTPLLDPNITSTRAVFIVTSDQINDVERLKSLLTPRAISVSYYLAPTHCNTQAQLDSYEEIFTAELLKIPDENVYFNATCGDRRNVLNAYDTARNLDVETYVIEPDLDSLYWLYPADKASTSLADKLKLKDYFKTHDITLGNVENDRGIKPEIRALGGKWVSDPTFFNQALGKLNYLAFTANKETLKTKKLDNSMLQDPALMTLIEDLEHIDYLQLHADVIKFKDEKSRFFANGGWLEEFVFGTIISLKKDIPTLQDCMQGVELERKIAQGFVKNEIDVVGLNNNILHIVECKTKKFEPGEGNEVIYKLDSLAELLGGENGRAILVSFKNIRLSESLRAKELDITVIGPQELPNFKAHIKKWLLSV